LKIPFTGLVVGGMAVIMICMIADLCEHKYKQLLKSALIVLIVKAMVSPFTPVTAYVAVSFQALLGFGLFSLLRVNLASILLLSIITMLESAIQKILILTLFFGNSLWKAMDNMIEWLSSQFGSIITNGSYWIIGFYLFIYLAGGIFITWLTNRTIKCFNSENPVFILDKNSTLYTDTIIQEKSTPKNKYKKLWVLVLTMVLLSVILFIFSKDNKQGWLAVTKTISWTLSVVLIWFMLLGPLLTKTIQRLLKKKETNYSDEVLSALSFLPILGQLAVFAWQQSKLQKGFKRWNIFFIVLIYTTLTYTEPTIADIQNRP